MTDLETRQRGQGTPVHKWWRNLSLGTRLVTAAALATTTAIVAVVGVAYVAVRHELLSNLDSQLRRQASELSVSKESFINSTGFHYILHVNTGVGDVGGYAQLVSATGQGTPAVGQTVALPVTESDINVARSGGHEYRDAEVGGLHLRILTSVPEQVRAAGATGEAIQIALPLTAVDSQLNKLRVAFLLLGLGGLALVVVGCWVVVRRTMRPVATLTEAAEQIAVTRDLTTRISDYGNDELGRLASTFNVMLDALEKSVGQQRQLILDASHELRTPLASLRTNVEVLHDVERLNPDQRRALLDGIVTQLDELTALVADVVELARGEAPETAQEDVAFDDLVTRAVERARRHWPTVIFMAETAPVMVRGVPTRLDRAVANLLDNAGKFSPSGAVVDVALGSSGRLTVADRGPGVPDDAVEHVFDRFYRADEARAMPGSGLGLAIVKQVVDEHNGIVTLANRPGGGAVAEIELPVLVGAEHPAALAEPGIEHEPVS
ncbi:MAG TPA: HAMP domain-containing sensor histidine kinase [Mycobacteriales bacterium]|nr:HAMP domain-containing sensor histidine kinase [Mycobacteriales bacterium]